MKCTGCQEINECEYGIKECCQDKAIKNCSKCVDYPCEKITITLNKTQENIQKFKSLLSKKEYDIFTGLFS